MAVPGVYQLRRPILAIQIVHDNWHDPFHQLATIPAGAEITFAGRQNHPYIDVRWGQQQLLLFAVDLERRGELVLEYHDMIPRSA